MTAMVLIIAHLVHTHMPTSGYIVRTDITASSAAQMRSCCHASLPTGNYNNTTTLLFMSDAHTQYTHLLAALTLSTVHETYVTSLYPADLQLP